MEQDTEKRDKGKREVQIKVAEGNCQEILENKPSHFLTPPHTKPSKHKRELCGVRKAILNEY